MLFFFLQTFYLTKYEGCLETLSSSCLKSDYFRTKDNNFFPLLIHRGRRPSLVETRGAVKALSFTAATGESPVVQLCPSALSICLGVRETTK